MVLCCALLAGCIAGETPQAAYPDLPAAVADGAVARGWIPDWLPADATDLHEIHDLDNNHSALRFQTDMQAPWAPPPSCRAIDAGQLTPSSLQVASWPSPASLRKGYRLYQCAEDGAATRAFLAIAGDGRHALYWRVRPG